MLEVDSQGTRNCVPVVDLHSHLGKEPVLDPSGRDSYRSTTLSDLIEFYEKMGHELVRRSQESSASILRVVSTGKPTSSLLQKIVEKAPSAQMAGWLLDHAITFPFNDALAAKTTPRFQKPNDRILLRTRDPHYGRIIPFCRVDPFDGKEAVKEVKRCVQLGARGLKLHPLSQHFVEKIRSDEVMDLLELSASLDIPVIFDVANAGVGEDIAAVVEETKSRLTSDAGLKVILGHFGFAYDSETMHDLIQRPEFFADLSGCRGEDVSLFFHQLIDHSGLSGINKISYASDFNYFGVPQCADFIMYVLSRDFQDLIGEENHLKSMQKVLGLNALSLFAPYQSILSSSPIAGRIWKISTEKLANQIITASKDRTVSLRPLFLSYVNDADVTAWTLRKTNNSSFSFLTRSRKQDSWVLMSKDLSQSSNLEKHIHTLIESETNNNLEKFDLNNAICSGGGK
ncbi:MAG: amidohydrolase family protein [Candidatus Thorarchaeota archaeon]